MNSKSISLACVLGMSTMLFAGCGHTGNNGVTTKSVDDRGRVINHPYRTNSVVPGTPRMPGYDNSRFSGYGTTGYGTRGTPLTGTGTYGTYSADGRYNTYGTTGTDRGMYGARSYGTNAANGIAGGIASGVNGVTNGIASGVNGLANGVASGVGGVANGINGIVNGVTGQTGNQTYRNYGTGGTTGMSGTGATYGRTGITTGNTYGHGPFGANATPNTYGTYGTSPSYGPYSTSTGIRTYNKSGVMIGHPYDATGGAKGLKPSSAYHNLSAAHAHVLQLGDMTFVVPDGKTGTSALGMTSLGNSGRTIVLTDRKSADAIDRVNKALTSHTTLRAKSGIVAKDISYLLRKASNKSQTNASRTSTSRTSASATTR